MVRPHQEMAVLSLEEKKYLLGVERGDVAGTRRVLQRARDTGHINVDCVDPLGRSALLMAIDNENLEMVELLLQFGVETRDALLHAISEEFVEAVEALLDHEKRIKKPEEPNVSYKLSSYFQFYYVAGFIVFLIIKSGALCYGRTHAYYTVYFLLFAGSVKSIFI